MDATIIDLAESEGASSAVPWQWAVSDEPPPDGTPIEQAAAYYARHRFAVVPLVGKNPAVYGDDWWTRAITDPYEALRVFASDSRFTNIGWAQGYGTVAVDVDHPENLTDEIRDVIRAGALNRTRSGRGHRVFETDGRYRCSVEGFPAKGWGDFRAEGGQIVIWGPHPEDTLCHYRYDPRQEVPPAPDTLLGWLVARGAYENAATPEEVDAFIAGHVEATNPSAMRAVFAHGSERIGRHESIHGTTVAISVWLCRDVRAGLYGAREALDALRAWWGERWAERAARPANSDGEIRRTAPSRNELAGIVLWAVAQAMAEPDENIASIRERFGSVRGVDLPVLPDEFWNARPILAQIRQAARARRAAPDALLGIILARIAAVTPHTVKLPPIIGGHVGLTYFVAPIAPSGKGKTAGSAVGRELIPSTSTVVEVPAGTGEGLTEMLFEKIDGEKQQTRFGLIVMVDEGSQLMEIAQRQGSTTMSMLRQGYTDGPIGSTNASLDRRRIVPAGQYVFGMVIGFQPEKAGDLLDDSIAGTPQRFVWLSAVDPTMPTIKPPWPDGLAWKPPDLARHDPVQVGAFARKVLGVPDHVVAEIDAAHVAEHRGEGHGSDPLDAHAGLVRLKTAALLAILDGRLEINSEDWELAGMVYDTSAGVRSYVLDRVKAERAETEQARQRKAAALTVHVEGEQEQRALNSGARSLARRVHKLGRAKRGDLHAAVAWKHRKLVGLDAMIDEAEAQDWIKSDGDEWVPGPKRP